MKKTGKATNGAKNLKKGLVGQVLDEAKTDLKTTPQAVTDALVKDAKQAVNYEIRRGFRSLINGIFKR